jgi:hypothetical protein
MAKDAKEEKENPEEKKPEIKVQKKSTCGCGCIPPVKTDE